MMTNIVTTKTAEMMSIIVPLKTKEKMIPYMTV